MSKSLKDGDRERLEAIKASPAFLASLESGDGKGKGGGANRKPLWREVISAKRLCHFIAGAAFDDSGRIIPHDDTRPRKVKGVHFLTLAQVRRVLAILHPVLNSDPKTDARGVPDGTLKGTWIRDGRAHRGGTPENPGLHKVWTEELKQEALEAVCKVTGADPKQIAPPLKAS